MKVKLYKQKNKLSCGPAALKMLMGYYGVNRSEKEIIKEVGGIKKYGVRMINLAEYARKAGFRIKCYSYNKKLAKGRAEIKKPDSKQVQDLLRKGIPVVLAVNSKILYNNCKQSIKGHFIVITEYKKGVYGYNDSRDGKLHYIKESDMLLAWYNNVLDSSAYLLSIWIHKK